MAPLMTRAVGLEGLSPVQRELVEQGFGGSLDSEKLVPDLGEHKKQMHSLRLLQVMAREGVEITALHLRPVPVDEGVHRQAVAEARSH